MTDEGGGYEEDSAPGLGGLGGLGDLLAQFQDAEQRLEEAAAEASATVVTGSAAAGQVTLEISGDLEGVSVHIDPSVVDPSDVSLLEDLVLAALRDALHQVADLQAEVAGSIDGPTFDLSGLLGNLGLGNLGSGFGLGNLADLGGDKMPGFGDLTSLIGGLGLSATDDDVEDDDAVDDAPSSSHTDDPDDDTGA